AVQYTNGLSGSFRVGDPQIGHSVGNWNLCSAPVPADDSTRTNWGMVYCAFSTTTMSPIRMSLRSISSALCRLALLTVVPASLTGGGAGGARGRFSVPP